MMGLCFILAANENAAHAQDSSSCACCTAPHRAFDFWLGEWEVRDSTGRLLGENNILSLERGCIISEAWRGAQGSTGRSYNYYNPRDSAWHQLWISSNGGILELKGRASPGKMVMSSAIQQTSRGEVVNRITWKENPDGSVTQRWDVLNREGFLLRTVFYGIYRKKSPGKR